MEATGQSLEIEQLKAQRARAVELLETATYQQLLYGRIYHGTLASIAAFVNEVKQKA